MRPISEADRKALEAKLPSHSEGPAQVITQFHSELTAGLQEAHSSSSSSSSSVFYSPGGAQLGRIGPLPENGQDFLVPTSKRAHVWPIEMKGTKRNQELKQLNRSPGLKGHTKRSREPALKQEGI